MLTLKLVLARGQQTEARDGPHDPAV